MATGTPTNMGKLVAKHMIKFIHGRTFNELEDDVNKRLAANVGKHEIKDIRLDLSQTGAWLAMIVYYEHMRMDLIKSEDNKTHTTKVITPLIREEVTVKRKQSVIGDITHKSKPVDQKGGTRHAPIKDTMADVKDTMADVKDTMADVKDTMADVKIVEPIVEPEVEITALNAAIKGSDLDQLKPTDLDSQK